MLIKRQGVNIYSELHDPGPPVSDGAGAVEVVAVGDRHGEVLGDVLLGVEPPGPRRAELGKRGAVLRHHGRRQVQEVGDLHQLGVGVFAGHNLIQEHRYKIGTGIF